MTVRRIKLYIIIALVAIVIFMSGALCFNSANENLIISNTAGAGGIASVGEIYKGVDSINKTKHFSGENLSKLYDYITGSDGSKLSDVNTLLTSTGELTAQDIRSNNDSKDVTVMFDIVLGVGMTLIFIEWTDSEGNAFTDGGSLKYSGDVQHPKAVARKDSADEEESE